MRKIIRVYISGPLTSPNDKTQLDLIKQAIEFAEVMLTCPTYGANYIPVIPHLKSFWCFYREHPHEFWMRLDRSEITTCQLLLRIPGLSVGAEQEEKWAKDLHIPIVYAPDDSSQELALLTRMAATVKEYKLA